MKLSFTTTLLVALAILAGCKQVDFTAPGGSTIHLVAQPSTVDKHEVSTLTVTGIRDNGAPLPDGTVVRFTVGDNLGDVTPNPVELKDGVAVARFVAGNLTGDATITAFSGDASADVTITVAKREASSIILTADPSSLPIGGGTVKLRAFVFDEDGNPVTGVKVFFQTDKGTLASHGLPVVTDSSGLAKDTLNTTETAQVTATTSNSVTADITINVAEGQAPTCSFSVTPSTSVAIGDQVLFLDTSSDLDGTIATSTWDFGDGGTAQGASATHTYNEAGTFFVLHSVTDDTGFTDTCDPVTITVSAPTS
jgi:chitodextrinase